MYIHSILFTLQSALVLATIPAAASKDPWEITVDTISSVIRRPTPTPTAIAIAIATTPPARARTVVTVVTMLATMATMVVVVVVVAMAVLLVPTRTTTRPFRNKP
jgi:hypothetical protein